jgi:hypothetical protein
LLTVIPAGRLSSSEKFVRFVSVGALIMILNLALPPAAMDEGEKDLDASRSVPSTVTVVVAGRKFPMPWSVVNCPGGIRLVNVPDGVPAGTVTGTEIVQVPKFVGLPAGIVPPVRLTEFAVVETVPPHVVVAVPATIKGLGRVSVTSTPV